MAPQTSLDQVTHELTRTLDELARLVWDAVPGCDGASLSVMHGDSVSTLVATEQRITNIDEAQYRRGDGPCVSAIRDRR